MNIDFTQFNTEELARIHNILNRWDWPEQLGDKPENWDTMRDHDYLRDSNEITKHVIITPIMAEIKNIIGLKECLRWHHLNNLDRSNEQFEKWWKKEEKSGFIV